MASGFASAGRSDSLLMPVCVDSRAGFDFLVSLCTRNHGLLFQCGDAHLSNASAWPTVLKLAGLGLA
jgi:hypothetical protein